MVSELKTSHLKGAAVSTNPSNRLAFSRIVDKTSLAMANFAMEVDHEEKATKSQPYETLYFSHILPAS